MLKGAARLGGFPASQGEKKQQTFGNRNEIGLVKPTSYELGGRPDPQDDEHSSRPDGEVG